MDANEVAAAVIIDPVWSAQLRDHWLNLMALAVWGEVKSTRMGATSRMRKRLLEVGEKMRSLIADRTWIPHPREQVKNALGSAYSLKDALQQFERAAQDADGGADYPAFAAGVLALHQSLLAHLPDLENRWAGLLDSQYNEDEDDDA
ncbi:hypothetical protein [Sulfuriferula nivalis]|uniref:Uncharacterized protein n=1 Tax=Sulfuriferula nivalis TaxID=2675298 RepID=A0A809SIJ5_9PROT|nr:hypothetical protein [Sulfuriferula nivalis]BBP02000.1 hypothetical protein SFSGTM_27080 [Sulfuriferula nivalis]